MVDILVDSEGKALTTGGKAIKATGGAAPIISSLNVTPTTSAQQITAPSSIDGYSPINVSAVTASIDQNITSQNIKKDVTILGVTGSYEGSTSQYDCVKLTLIRQDNYYYSIHMYNSNDTFNCYLSRGSSQQTLYVPKGYTYTFATEGMTDITYKVNDGSNQYAYTSFSYTINNDTTITYVSITSSCILEDTNIIMSNNTTKQIKDININDKILGYDENNHSTTEVDVLNVHQHLVNKIYEIITSNNDSIKVTAEHLLLSDKGWSAINVKSSSLAYSNVNNIQQLNIGDKLIDKDNNEQTIISINEITGQFNVYTLDVTDGIDTFITNNYISHNKAG